MRKIREIIYMLVVDIWRLAAKYDFCKMGDDEWEDFISSGQKLVIRYRPYGEAVERLCRDMLDAIRIFYQRGGET